MSAWGSGGAAKSCNSLLRRVDDDDPRLVDLVVLPMKTFGDGELRRLASSIHDGRNTRLRSISASGHAVSPGALSALGAAIAVASERGGGGEGGIRSLAIGDRSMGDEGVAALFSALGKVWGGTLQTLELGFKDLSRPGMEAIGSCFGGSRHLHHLNLSRNERIGGDGLEAFCEAGALSARKGDKGQDAFPHLQYFDLSECKIGPIGVLSLSDCLLGSGETSRGRSKMELMLVSNPLGEESCLSLSRLLWSPVDGSSTLISLSLARCSLGDDGVKNLVTATRGGGEGLCMLDLSHNGITWIGAQKLAESLCVRSCEDDRPTLTDLSEIRLAGNPLGGDGVTVLTGSLRQRSDIHNVSPGGGNETVSVLDLSNTSCGVDGAAAALSCGALSTLLLFNNSLGSDGFNALLPLLRSGHPSLVSLDLGGNRADEGAVASLLLEISVRSDERESKMQTLVIGGNAFGSEVESALKELKHVSPCLDVAHDRPTRRQETYPR